MIRVMSARRSAKKDRGVPATTASAAPAAPAAPARRVVQLKVLQPGDIRLRGIRTYTWIRRTSLAISFALTVALPIWHLGSIEGQSAGIAGGGRWAAVADATGLTGATPPLVGGPVAISLFGLELVDPTAIVTVLLSAGPSWQLLWAAWPAALLVIVFGRFFCGWICPYVPVIAASNATRSLLARMGFRTRDVPLPRRSSLVMLAVLLAASAVTGSQIIPLIYPPAIISREVFRAVFWGGLGLGALVVLAAYLFDTFVSRAGFCRYLCPGGALFGILGAASPVRITRTPALCTDCTICDAVCNLLQNPMSDHVDRGCERCGKCVASCPTDALTIGFGKPALFDRKPPEARP